MELILFTHELIMFTLVQYMDKQNNYSLIQDSELSKIMFSMVSLVWMVDRKAMMKTMFGIFIIDDWGKKLTETNFQMHTDD